MRMYLASVEGADAETDVVVEAKDIRSAKQIARRWFSDGFVEDGKPFLISPRDVFVRRIKTLSNCTPTPSGWSFEVR